MHSVTFENDSVIKNVFEKVREEPNAIWQKIHESEAFKTLVQVGVGIGTTIVFVAVFLPATLLLATITAIGFIALGITSPALCHSRTAEIWEVARDKLVGMATDLFYLPKAILVTPFAFEQNPSRNQPGNQNPLIVFDHGFLHNKTCFSSLGEELQDVTRDSDHPITEKDIYAINFGAPITLEKIDHYARFLATKLELIRSERGLDTLDVIFDCHSMGGLVAAHFMAHYASDARVNLVRLIANGTPWHGTPVAYIAFWAACGIEMWPRHEFQTELAANIDTFKDKIFPIATRGDTIVPFLSALGSELEIPTEHKLELDVPCGHLAMLHDPQCRESNIQWITEAWDNALDAAASR